MIGPWSAVGFTLAWMFAIIAIMPYGNRRLQNHSGEFRLGCAIFSSFGLYAGFAFMAML